MDNFTLTVKLLALKDSTKQNLGDILYYIKKLTQIPSEQNRETILEPNKVTNPLVVSSNESFNWNVNEGNFCQVIFLLSKNQTVPRGDIILHFNYLFDLLNDKKNNKKNQSELFCTVRRTKNRVFYLNLGLFVV